MEKCKECDAQTVYTCAVCGGPLCGLCGPVCYECDDRDLADVDDSEWADDDGDDDGDDD